MSASLIFPAEPHKRILRKLRSWWGRGFWNAVEELADDESQVLQARKLARSGRIGGLVVDAGRVAAGVAEEAGVWTVTITVPVWGVDEHAGFVVVASGRAAVILGGRLTDDLAEHAEEAGVEIVPDSTELIATCSCPTWQRMSRTGGICEHALGVLVQVSDLIDQDPLVLLHLRGVTRAELEVLQAPPEPDAVRDDPSADAGRDEIELALEAAMRAAQLLEDAELD